MKNNKIYDYSIFPHIFIYDFFRYFAGNGNLYLINYIKRCLIQFRYIYNCL